ncbi:hypothetical protein HYX02_03905 [Candidatus Woesearchaeota archaeon]|nr:hypothetical protein [Candidatus Woesearchaeota archaeon]
MAKKRGQITIVMALAIVMLIIAALTIYVLNYYKKNFTEPLVFEKASIENYINNCIKKTAEDGVKLLGKQGGYINLEDSIKAQNNIAVLSLNNKSKAQPIAGMENDLSNYLKNNLNSCLKNFKDFKRQGWQVEAGSIKAAAKINENDVTFEANFPMSVNSKGDTIKFERFVIMLNVRLKYVYELVDSIVDFKIKHNRDIDLKDATKYDVEIVVFLHNKNIIYAIYDHKYPILNKPYMFIFGLEVD